jgi:thiol:disulfide interchange protein
MIFYTLFRSLMCVVIVFATYNPTGHSYWHWAMAGMTTTKAAFGVLLIVIYFFLFWVVLGSLRITGSLSGLAVAGLGGYQIYQVIAPITSEQTVIETIILLSLALFLGIGLSWPALMTRLTGQTHKRYLTKAKRL